MPHLSWSEVRERAIRFSRTWSDATSERADKQTFYNEFFDVFGIRRASVASFEANVRNLHGAEQQVLDVRHLLKVDVDQFYGIEYSEWPVRIAEVAMWLMDHQMNGQAAEIFGQGFDRLPLRSSPHIVQGNALRVDWNSILPRAQCSYVLGNPPFIGKKARNAEQQADMERVWGAVKGAGVLDYVTCWYRRAAEYITGGASGSAGVPPADSRVPRESSDTADAAFAKGTPNDARGVPQDAEHGRRDARATRGMPFTIPAAPGDSRADVPRVAFVSTNSISQGEQVGILWGDLFQRFHLKIHFAHRTFAWMSEARGKAHVHVVIIGFGVGDVAGKRIFDYEADKTAPTEILANNISPYLVEASDVVITNRSTPVSDVPEAQFGSMPNDDGNLLFDDVEKNAFLAAEPQAAPLFRAFLSAHDYLHGESRWCLWLADAEPALVRRCPKVMERIEAIHTYRLASTREATRKLATVPGLFGEIRAPRSRFVLIPCHSAETRVYVPFSYFDPVAIPNNSCLFLEDATPFHFGVLASSMNMAWMRAVCGRLESRYRYSAGLVYNNFPWPNPTPVQRARVEEKARAVLAAREPHLPPRGLATLADLYDPNTMPRDLLRAHSELDRAVEKCYRVEHLFSLYEKLTAPLLPATPRTRGRRST